MISEEIIVSWVRLRVFTLNLRQLIILIIGVMWSCVCCIFVAYLDGLMQINEYISFYVRTDFFRASWDKNYCFSLIGTIVETGCEYIAKVQTCREANECFDVESSDEATVYCWKLLTRESSCLPI